jgi:hypothetical protein
MTFLLMFIFFLVGRRDNVNSELNGGNRSTKLILFTFSRMQFRRVVVVATSSNDPLAYYRKIIPTSPFACRKKDPQAEAGPDAISLRPASLIMKRR